MTTAIHTEVIGLSRNIRQNRMTMEYISNKKFFFYTLLSVGVFVALLVIVILINDYAVQTFFVK